MESNENCTLLDALGLYASTPKTKNDHPEAQKQLLRFVSWCGADRAIADIRPSEIGEYGERTVGTGGGAQIVERLQEVKKFLSFAKKKGLIQQNLSQHLRIRKSKARVLASASSSQQNTVELTHEGHVGLVNELDRLKAERVPIASEIRRAAADKDVRENVPLEAAREQLGHVESRIRQIESTLLEAVVVNPARRGENQTVRLGAHVLLKDLDSGRETKYTLVGASEAKPLEGKISDVSPVGKAMLRRSAGHEIEVNTPRGKLRYRIVRVSW